MQFLAQNSNLEKFCSLAWLHCSYTVNITPHICTSGKVLYFLKISPHLEIPLPSKCCRIFQPTHLNKRRPRNLTAWYGLDKISVCTRALYVHTNRLITEAVYARACQSVARRCPQNLAALKLSPHGTAH